MELSREITESSCSSSKKQRVSELEKEDRISSLPDHILAHILSFLPTKDAVKTVLLRTFGKVWTSIHNLDFRVTGYPRYTRFLNFVDQIILLHESPTVVNFFLTFSTAFKYETRSRDFSPRSIADKIDSWINFAIGKEVKILKLDISDWDLYHTVFYYNLPQSVFNTDCLTELNLVSCGFKPQGQILMRSLKTLSLVKLILCDSLIEELLSGCPSLENLSMIRCYDLHKLNLTHACLKSLMITLGEGETSRLEISCPNVKSLNISGAIWRADLKNSYSLVDAHLDFSSGGRYSDGEYKNVRLLLEELSHAKIIKICNWCILVLSIWEWTHLACPSFNRKCIVLKTMLTKWHLLGIASLLKNSPNLEMLTIYIEPGTSILTSDDVMWLQAFGIHRNNWWNDETRLRSFYLDVENFWNSQQPVRCLTTSLKTVEIYGCIVNPYVIPLLKFLLMFSNVLEKMVISTKGNAQPNQQNPLSSGELVEFSQNLSSFQKASNRVVILFS